MKYPDLRSMKDAKGKSTIRVVKMSKAAFEAYLFEAYRRGFVVSGEGWNGEMSAGDDDLHAWLSRHFQQDLREMAVKHV